VTLSIGDPAGGGWATGSIISLGVVSHRRCCPGGPKKYVAGITGEKTGRDVDVPLSFLGQTRCTMTLIEDGQSARTFANEAQGVTSQDHIEVRLQPYGGFVAVLTPTKSLPRGEPVSRDQ